MNWKLPFTKKQKGRSSRHVSNLLTRAKEEDNIFQEQFKAFRSKFEWKIDALGWKAIGFTSAIAGEGKTLACAKLAVAIAMTRRKRVLVVDADIRKADMSLGVNRLVSPGLSEFLLGTAGWGEITKKTEIQYLEAISAGRNTSNPTDLFAGARFHEFIGRARDEYDIILLDAPPVIPVADAMAFRDHLDGFVFLYRMGVTPLSMFLQATEEIGEKKILGVVLNGAERKSDNYYSRYYGEYYVKTGTQTPADSKAG